MRRLTSAICLAALLGLLATPLRADDPPGTQVLDKRPSRNQEGVSKNGVPP